MKTGNAAKYFKYAIGEIFLVVFGILIALQINNWNQQKKADKLELQYYCRLLEDVVQDKEQIDEMKILIQKRIVAANNAIRLLKGNKALKTEVGKELGISITALASEFTPNNSAFDDLKSGANLNIIKDKSIIKAINNYLNKTKGFLNVIKVNGDNALDRFFGYKDLYSNGWLHFQMTGQFKISMDKDVYELMNIDLEETLTEDMKYQLLNDALRFLYCNSRQLQLYNLIQDEADILIEQLEHNCKIKNNED